MQNRNHFLTMLTLALLLLGAAYKTDWVTEPILNIRIDDGIIQEGHSHVSGIWSSQGKTYFFNASASNGTLNYIPRLHMPIWFLLGFSAAAIVMTMLRLLGWTSTPSGWPRGMLLLGVFYYLAAIFWNNPGSTIGMGPFFALAASGLAYLYIRQK